jgi:hypothetical protein
MSFPALVRSDSLCDGLDDGGYSLWEPVIFERDGLRVAHEELIGTDSHIRNPVGGSYHEVRLSDPPRAHHDLQIGLHSSDTSGGKNGDEDSLEPH